MMAYSLCAAGGSRWFMLFMEAGLPREEVSGDVQVDWTGAVCVLRSTNGSDEVVLLFSVPL